MATNYPPDERDHVSPEELTELVQSLSEKISIDREQAKNRGET